jgi:hypothetical protein
LFCREDGCCLLSSWDAAAGALPLALQRAAPLAHFTIAASIVTVETLAALHREHCWRAARRTPATEIGDVCSSEDGWMIDVLRASSNAIRPAAVLDVLRYRSSVICIADRSSAHRTRLMFCRTCALATVTISGARRRFAATYRR